VPDGHGSHKFAGGPTASPAAADEIFPRFLSEPDGQAVLPCFLRKRNVGLDCFILCLQQQSTHLRVEIAFLPMATKRDGLRMWWSKFEQIENLAELLGKSISSLVDDYIAAAPVYKNRRSPVGFEEYVMNRAAQDKSGILRDFPRYFFELMDTSALMEGNKSTRSRECWIRTAPLIPPLAGSETVAGMIFDELVRVTENTRELSVERFEEYVQVC
jgi:hypothetical protein